MLLFPEYIFSENFYASPSHFHDSVNYIYLLIHLIRIYGLLLKHEVFESHNYAIPIPTPPSHALCPNNLCGMCLCMLCLN